MVEIEDGAPVLRFQLDMLKVEVDVVNSTIRQMDDITKSLKEWAITVWAAALGGSIITAELRTYTWATAVIPLLFWVVDVWHRVVQRRFIWRGLQIKDFLNSKDLEESFAIGRLVRFEVMDVGARRCRSPEFYRFVSWRRVMLFGTLTSLYLGLAVLSVGVWALVNSSEDLCCKLMHGTQKRSAGRISGAGSR